MMYDINFLKQSPDGSQYRSLVKFTLNDPTPLEWFTNIVIRQWVFSDTIDYSVVTAAIAQGLSDAYEWAKDNS